MDRVEKQKHLLECNKEKSYVEERCNHLQTQLDLANENLRKVSRRSVDKVRLDTEICAHAELKQAFDELRHSSQERDLEHRAATAQMRQENEVLREEAAKRETLAADLRRKFHTAKAEWKAKEKRITSCHDAKVQTLREAVAANDALVKTVRALEEEVRAERK